jgi:hypothetical protein
MRRGVNIVFVMGGLGGITARLKVSVLFYSTILNNDFHPGILIEN